MPGPSEDSQSDSLVVQPNTHDTTQLQDSDSMSMMISCQQQSQLERDVTLNTQAEETASLAATDDAEQESPSGFILVGDTVYQIPKESPFLELCKVEADNQVILKDEYPTTDVDLMGDTMISNTQSWNAMESSAVENPTMENPTTENPTMEISTSRLTDSSTDSTFQPLLEQSQTPVFIMGSDGNVLGGLGQSCTGTVGNKSDSVSGSDVNGNTMMTAEKPQMVFQVFNEDAHVQDVNVAVLGPREKTEGVSPLKGTACEKRPFRCDLCSATFTRLGNYTRHRMVHTVDTKDEFRYKCGECGHLFLQRADLKRHQQKHAGTEPYQCSTCKQKYIRRSDLVVHMRFHNKDRAFKCSRCDKAYHQSGDLSRHIRNAHEKHGKLTCGHCRRGFANERTLIRHMQTAHKNIIVQSASASGQLSSLLQVQYDHLEESQCSDPGSSVMDSNADDVMTTDSGATS